MSDQDVPAPIANASSSSGSSDDSPAINQPAIPDDMQQHSPSAPSADALKELYRIYRSYEEHENGLLNQRVTWLITVQSVLIASFAFMIHKNYELAEKIIASGKPYPRFIFDELDLTSTQVLYVIATAGFFFALVAALGVATAIMAQREIRTKWASVAKDNSKHPTLTQLPPLAGGGHWIAATLGGAFAASIPSFFTLLWGFAIWELTYNSDFFGVTRFFKLVPSIAT